MLHIAPQSDESVKGTLLSSTKIRNVLLLLGKKFEEVYLQRQHLSIDKSAVAFKGWASFKT